MPEQVFGKNIRAFKLGTLKKRKVLKMSEERDDVVVLVDEEGGEHQFAVVDIFPVEQKDYAVLAPLENLEEEQEEEGDDEAYIFRIEEVDGEQTLVEVDSEEEWNNVAAEWENRLKQWEEFSEGEEE